MPRREVATCLLTNWVLDSLNHTRMAVKFVCFKIAREHASFANSSSTSDVKSLSSCFLTYQIQSVIRTYPRCRSGPPISYGHPSYRADKSHNVYLSNAGSFLSLPIDASLDVWHRVGLSQNCLSPRGFRYPVGFVESTEPN